MKCTLLDAIAPDGFAVVQMPKGVAEESVKGRRDQGRQTVLLSVRIATEALSSEISENVQCLACLMIYSGIDI